MTTQQARPVERPIILRQHEVATLLKLEAGQRFVLWRAVKPPPDPYYKHRPEQFHQDFFSVASAAQGGWIFWSSPTLTEEQRAALAAFTRRAYDEGIPCPYGDVGDVLWGRETWAAISPDEFWRPIAACDIEYRADGEWSRFPGDWPPEYHDDPERPRWRPPLTMPRWASRIGLLVLSALPERLHDATDELVRFAGFATVEAFRTHWEATNKGLPWSLNPWVWTIVCQRTSLSPVARPVVEEDEVW